LGLEEEVHRDKTPLSWNNSKDTTYQNIVLQLKIILSSIIPFMVHSHLEVPYFHISEEKAKVNLSREFIKEEEVRICSYTSFIPLLCQRQS
jgi:hypothetical protein